MRRRLAKVALAAACVGATLVGSASRDLAATLTNPTWTASNTTVTVTGVSYTYAFTTASTATLSSVTMTVPAGTGGTPGVGTVSGVGAGTAALAGTTLTYSINSPASVAAGTAVSIQLTGLTNTATGGTFTSTITTFKIFLLFPTAVDTGTTNAVSITVGWVTNPGNPSFSDTLNGLDQTVTATLPLDVADGTLSAGWNITATSTSFTTGAHTLSAAATRVLTAPTVTCDGSCTLATNSVGYPYTLPAGPSAPTATKLFNAAANSGIGNQTVTPTFTVAIPANSFAGSYTSTWTITVASGP